MYVRMVSILVGCLVCLLVQPAFANCSPVFREYNVSHNPGTYGAQTDDYTYNAVLSQIQTDINLGITFADGACVRARFQNGTFQYFRVNMSGGVLNSLSNLGSPMIRTNGSAESCGMHNERSGGLSGYIQSAWVCYGNGDCVIVDYMYVQLPYYDQSYGGPSTMCGDIIV